MPEEIKYECPECGTSVNENESKCPGCGAVFDEGPKEAAEGPEVAIVTAEKIEDERDEPVKEAEKIGTTEDTHDSGEEKKKKDEEKPDETEEGPPVHEPKKAGPNKVGIVISVVGMLGVMGAVLLDPLMNLLDSKHPADINIGTTQMAGVLVAAIVLVAGLVITFAMRKGK